MDIEMKHTDVSTDNETLFSPFGILSLLVSLSTLYQRLL